MIDMDVHTDGEQDDARHVRVRVEVPRFSFVKRGAEGGIDFVSIVPCPFNYGSVLGTRAPDGDPVDAIVLGPRRRRGELVPTVVWGEVRFVDDGVRDAKLVCGKGPATPFERKLVHLFFRLYAPVKRLFARLRGSGAVTRYEGIVWREAKACAQP
jgi:inorganic pyrophosphatase